MYQSAGPVRSPPHHSIHKFRPLLPDEAPEVNYEPATELRKKNKIAVKITLDTLNPSM